MTSSTFTNMQWFEIEKSEELGRYMVAAVDIPARSVILKEKPMVCGPADYDQSEELGKIPMCLGCFTRLVDCPDGRCTSCGWPVCGEECEKISYHAENECELFRNNGIAFPPPHQWPISNKSILILRCWLMKNRRPDYWQDLMKFEHHNDIRKSKPYCVNGDAMVLENMRYFLKEPHLQLSEDEIAEFMRISGIINVNAFTTMREVQQRVTIAQCMFRVASIFAHSCVPNANWCMSDSDLTMTIRTAIPIRKGEMITIPYSVRDNLCGTLQRLISTEDVAHFLCKCRRCADPTELGTNVSGIKCPTHSCPGYLLPLVSTDVNSIWKCMKVHDDPNRNNNNNKNERNDDDSNNLGHCDFCAPVRRIVPILNKVDTKIDLIKKDIEYLDASSSEDRIKLEGRLQSLETLRYDCEKIFHKNHYLIQEIRLFIIKERSKTFEKLNLRELNLVISHCEYLLDIANILNPGYCGHRAMLQFYLSRALHFKAKQLKLLMKRKKKSIVPQELIGDGDQSLFDGSQEKLDDETCPAQETIDNLNSQVEELEKEAFLYFDPVEFEED